MSSPALDSIDVICRRLSGLYVYDYMIDMIMIHININMIQYSLIVRCKYAVYVSIPGIQTITVHPAFQG